MILNVDEERVIVFLSLYGTKTALRKYIEGLDE